MSLYRSKGSLMHSDVLAAQEEADLRWPWQGMSMILPVHEALLGRGGVWCWCSIVVLFCLGVDFGVDLSEGGTLAGMNTEMNLEIA